MNVRFTLLTLLSVAFTGCSSITGLVDASDKFGCPIENGVRCSSLSQTHERLHEERRGKESLKVAPSAATPSVAQAEKSPLSETPETAVKPVSQSVAENPAPRSVTPYKEEKTQETPNPKPESPAMRHTSRVAERVMELWVLPWVDEDGDLNSETHLWVRVRDARWGIERLRDAAMRQYLGSDAL